VSFRSYWTRVLLEALRDVRGEMSVEELSKKTFIMATDVTDTLQVRRGARAGAGQQPSWQQPSWRARPTLRHSTGPAPQNTFTHPEPHPRNPPPQALGLLKYIKGSYYISASQRVVEEHLRQLQPSRGLELDPACLHWQPLQSPSNQGRKK
jgi:hypothetical protein